MTSIPDISPDLEAAAKRVEELSEQVTAQAKANGLVWLEGYEKVLQNLLDLEVEAAKKTGRGLGQHAGHRARRISSGRPPKCSSRP